MTRERSSVRVPFPAKRPAARQNRLRATVTTQGRRGGYPWLRRHASHSVVERASSSMAELRTFNP